MRGIFKHSADKDYNSLAPTLAESEHQGTVLSVCASLEAGTKVLGRLWLNLPPPLDISAGLALAAHLSVTAGH